LLQRDLVANGTKRHFVALQQTVAFGGKADIAVSVDSATNGPPVALRQRYQWAPADSAFQITSKMATTPDTTLGVTKQ
jgi:hypothetical protein